ncbi:MAG TPA: CHAT domain-containing protein [Kribbella sp.]|nr:CHAT domain-containing protein [Kribbella sp.]
MTRSRELFDQGMAHYDAVRLQAAAVCFRSALDQLGADDDRDQLTYFACLHLGWIAAFHGRFRPAVNWFIRCLEAAESASFPDTLAAGVLLHLAKAEHDLGLQQGPAILTAEYVNEPTLTLLRDAEHHLDDARRLLGDVEVDKLPEYVTSVVLSAEVARAQEDLGTAVQLARHALECMDSRPIPQQVAWSVVREYALAGVHTDGPAQVAELVSSMLAQTEQLEPSPEVVDCLAAAVQAAALADEADLMSDFAGRLLEVDWQLIGHQLSGRSARQARHVFNAFRRRAEIVLGAYLVEPTYDEEQNTWEIPSWLYEVSLNRKGILAEREGRVWLDTRSADLTELLDARRRLAAIDLGDHQEATIKGTRLRYDEASQRLDEIESGLLEATESSAPPYLRAEDVLAQLDEGQMLLDLVVVRTPDGQARYGVMQVRPGHPVRYRDLGDVGLIDDAIAEAVRQLTQPGSDDPADLLGGLRLVDEDPPYHLLVSPTGTWAKLPPYLLPDATGRPLIENHLVTLVPSARWLAGRTEQRPASRPPGPPLVIGDPDFDLDLDDHKDFFLRFRPSRLKHSRAEAEAVAAILGVAPALDGDARRGTLLKVAGPRVLHLATHGMFIDSIGSLAELREPRTSRMRAVFGVPVREELEPSWSYQEPIGSGLSNQEALHLNRARWLHEVGPTDQASRSVLLLAGFNAWIGGVPTPEEVGVGAVSASELTLLDLEGTELVVLSACSTGVGAVDYADGGHIGLRTAAVNAGARSVISTLWEVLDRSTVVAMTKYYDLVVNQGAERAEALRSVLLELRAEHPDPYYWAGWVIEGESGPLGG